MSSPHLSSPLRRRSLIPLAALFCGGCVIPIAPQWDDAEINYPPYVVSSAPSEGDIFTPGLTTPSTCLATAPACERRDISATLSDENINDHLFIRWLVDY